MKSIKLRVIERIVKSAFGDKLCMVSLLDYRAVLYDENGIGILNSRETVCDDKAGLVLHKSGHSRLYLYLGT